MKRPTGRNAGDLKWSQDATPQARQARHFAEHGGSKAVTGMPLGQFGGCWCGEPQGHDWPGRADGAPHPRELTR